MRLPIALAVLCSVAFASTAPAKNGDSTSWGKAGVPLEEYTRDARECAETSRYVTTYIKPKTLRNLDALSSAQLLDVVIQAGGSANAMNIVGDVSQLRAADDIARRTNTFGDKFAAVVSIDTRDQLQAVIDKCLIERGYTRIRLTESQDTALRRFRRHSPERTAYLYSIDSNPTSVEQQRLQSNQ